MDKQFLRQAEIILNGRAFKSNDFDFEFDVDFTDEPKKNHLEVSIYNLSHNTINQIRRGSSIIVNAGYKGDVGSVFVGAVYDSDSNKEGVDRTTTIRAVDATNQRDKLRVNKTYKEGTRASQIITDLCGMVGLSIGALRLPNDMTYRQGKYESGVILNKLKHLAEDCGAKFHINKGLAYFRATGDGDDVSFLFSPKRGLIGTPELFIEEDEEENEIRGYNVSALLNHRIQADSIIQIQSNTANGSYRVIEGVHSYSDSEMVTEMKVV